MNVMYRKATADDIDALVKLRMDYLNETQGGITFDEEPIIASQLKTYFTGTIDKNFFAVFAEIDGEIVSAAFLTVFDKPARPSFITGRTATLLNVLTYPEYRRKGLATQVVKMLIDEAKSLNVSYIELLATTAGKPLYEKLGFAEKELKYTEMQLPLI